MKRHIARPGPAYWDWRCMTCGMEVRMRKYHLAWWETVNWWDVAIAVAAIAIIVFAWLR